MSGLYNPPGLSQISFRIGTWATFRAAMLERLGVTIPPGADSPPLADIALQGPDDWVTALIDAWAVVGDILTFYQERIANEGYLGTATQPFSIAQLFQMVGFPPPLPTAAETHLAFTVGKTTGAGTPAGPGSLLLPAGSPVRSLPVPARIAADLDQLVSRLALAGSAPGGPSPAVSHLEQLVAGAAGTPPPPAPPGGPPPAALPTPQIFETTDAVAVHPGWNSLQPRVRVRVERQVVLGSTTELRLAGTSTGLAVGQPILITGDHRPARAFPSYVRVLIAVETDRAQGSTRVRWEQPLDGESPLRRLARPQVFAFGKQLALFGATAKDWASLPRTVKRRFAPILGGVLEESPPTPGGPVWTSRNDWLPLVNVNALATSAGALFAGTAGNGVYRSTGGGPWQPASNGLSRKTIQCLLATGPPGQILAGGIGGVSLSTDSGETWEPLAGGPPRVVPAHPPGGSPQIVPASLPATVVRALAGFCGLLVAGTDSGIFTYDGTAWSQAVLAEPESPPLPAMDTPTYAFAGGSPAGTLYAAASEGVYQSTDGKVWSLTPSLSATAWPLRALAIAGGFLFAGGYDGVYTLSLDVWTRLAGLDGPITVLVSDGTELWAGTAEDGLWSSRDLGQSWTRTLLSPSPILALLATGGSLIAATPFDGFATASWPGFHLQDGQVDLGTTDSKIVAGGRVALLQSRPDGPPRSGGHAITKVETVQRQGFLLDATITRLLVTPGTGLAGYDLPTTQAWVESQELELSAPSVLVPTPVCGRVIVLDSQVTTPLPPRQKLAVSGKALNAVLLPDRSGGTPVVIGAGGTQTLDVGTVHLFVYQPSPGARASLDQGNLPDGLVEAFTANKTPLSGQATVAPHRRGALWIVQDQNDTVYFLISRLATSIQVSAPGAVLRVTGPPRRVKGSFARRWPVADQLGFTGTVDVLPGELLLLSARQSDPASSEVARLKEQDPVPQAASAVVHADDRRRTTLHLEKPLQGFYDAATVTVQANVVHATSGQSVREVLGSSDAAKPNQSFAVKRLPVVHVATDEGAARSTLAVTVGGVPWREVPSLGQAGPDSQVFAIAYDTAGFATVTFGDGVNGARPPSGRDNIVAFYRGGGTGPEAEVGPGSIVQLLASPGSAGRIHRVTNPQPAVRAQTGGTAPGQVAPPSAITTLRRIVTAGDFANLLLTLPGVAGARARRLWTGEGFLAGITVLPADGQPLTPGSPLDRQITAALQASAAPGTLVQVTSPRSVYFDLEATLWVSAGTPAALRQSVSAAAQQALADAFGATGSRLARAVTAAQAVSLLQRVPGVAGAVLQALYLEGDPPGLHTGLAAADVSWNPRARAVEPAELLLLDTRGGLTLNLEDAP